MISVVAFCNGGCWIMRFVHGRETHSGLGWAGFVDGRFRGLLLGFTDGI